MPRTVEKRDRRQTRVGLVGLLHRGGAIVGSQEPNRTRIASALKREARGAHPLQDPDQRLGFAARVGGIAAAGGRLYPEPNRGSMGRERVSSEPPGAAVASGS